MNYDYTETPLSKSVLAGLATGIIATVINLIYNFVFRGITRLSLPISIINVTSVIFASVVVSIVAGLVFHVIVFYLKKSATIYQVLFAVMTVLVMLSAMQFQRSNDQNITRQFDTLYVGMVIITGLSVVLFIPWLTRHKNVFFD